MKDFDQVTFNPSILYLASRLLFDFWTKFGLLRLTTPLSFLSVFSFKSGVVNLFLTLFGSVETGVMPTSLRTLRTGSKTLLAAFRLYLGACWLELLDLRFGKNEKNCLFTTASSNVILKKAKPMKYRKRGFIFR